MRNYSEYTVDDLVRLTLHGERDAYCELVRRYMNAVFRHTLNLTNDYHTAEDITQDTFIDGYTQLISLAEPSKYYAWLCGISRRKCFNHNAREHHFGDLDDYEEILSSDVPSPDDILIRNETSACVRAAVMTLSDKNRAAAELFYLDGLSAAAVAERLQIPLGTVKRRLYDTRQQLKKELYYMKDDYTLPADFEAEVKQKIKDIEDYYLLYKCKDEKAVKLIKQAEEIAGKITDEKAKYNALTSVYNMSVLQEEYLIHNVIKNTESIENAKAICNKLINDAFAYTDANELLNFIDETALPRIRSMDYSEGIAKLLYWKSYSLVRLKKYNDAKVCINEAKRLMDPCNIYYSSLLSSLRLIEMIENNPERLKMSACNITAACLRYRYGMLFYNRAPEFFISRGLRFSDIPSIAVISSAARCCGLLFEMNMKAGDTKTNTSAYDNTTLTYIGRTDGVTAGGRKFDDCLKYTLHADDIEFTFDADIYYAENVGLVRIDYEKGDKKACAELSDYKINDGSGYMPLAMGNKWSYKNTQLSSIYNQTIEYEIVYSNGENAELAGMYCIYVDENFENNPDTDSDLLIRRADEYYDEGKYDDTIRCLKLAVQRNTNINAVAVAVNAIQHFERLIEYKHKGYITRPSPVGGDEIEIKDGKIIYYEGIYFGITRGLPRYVENKYYSVLPFRYLQTLCGCLFDPRWKAGFTEDREYEQYPDKLTAHIEVEECGLVTVKAGTFENCLKVTVTSEKDGELEKNRRYYWWSYDCCGKKTFYFAPNIGVVRHECDWGNGDLVSVCELSEYTSTATAGEYMPVYIGCSWVYDETTIEDAYILRKVYRVTHGMNHKFFLMSEQDFTYCGTESEYNAMRSNDK